jgi:4-hydroxythreonine-4-phosphate dehydrogenase
MVKIGITMGCPAGIGPEIILQFLAETTPSSSIQPIIVGDIGVLARAAEILELPVALASWQAGMALPKGATPVVEVSSLPPNMVRWGLPNDTTGRAMANYIETGVALHQEGVLQGLTTCPISKLSLNHAGYNFPGHTEMLATLTKSSDYAMMMAGKRLRITLVTIHRPLRQVAHDLSIPAILRLIRLTSTALTIDFAIHQPRIAVAGFNPHAGEHGLFGDEEELVIAPAIDQGRQQGIDVSGPYPPDTIFYKAAAGEFDAVVAMYHDQGLIPFKLLHFDDGVNVTLGLPIVRTSVDHGTAYDIAGQGRASHRSLSEAVRLAADISRNRTAFQAG